MLNEAQQEAGYELEAIECMTADLRVCGGLEGGFISFDKHALMLSIDLIVVFAKAFSPHQHVLLITLYTSQ
jgi:hypothetical protein